MNWIALKMLTGNRAKYYAIIFGISFAVMLMSQQAAIFVGLMRNTTSQIRDIQGADIWVMDPSVAVHRRHHAAVEQRRPASARRAGRRLGRQAVQRQGPRPVSRGQLQAVHRPRHRRSDAGRRADADAGWARWATCGGPTAIILDESGYHYLFPGQAAGDRPRLRDERSSRRDRRHLQGVADVSDFSDRLYDL